MTDKDTSPKEKKTKKRLAKKWRVFILLLVWIVALSPLIFIYAMVTKVGDNLPGFDQLENPPDLQASIIYSADGKEMGRYWSVNRKNVNFHQISPYMVSALIATEDERYYKHAGIDGVALMRAVYNMGGAGGASTISQQLAKLLFTEVASSTWERIEQKFGENIIATRLERSYTKEEIITMYLNRFDFLNNAVGISSAAQVYFNTTPDSLKMEQAALLVGMCKNPSMFNPLRFEDKALKRREVVLKQWLKNKDNPDIPVHISQAQYDSLRELPLNLDYQIVDHKKGIAPYFREVLREELQEKLQEKNADGSYKYTNKDGEPYDIYRDGLRIYTTIDSRMQNYAENAVEKHLSETLQEEFFKNNDKWKNPPFANNVDQETIENIMNSAMKRSDRYRSLKKAGFSEAQIKKNFNTPVETQLFSWDGPIDTLISPIDSIRYSKEILQAGLMTVDPKTGFVKAWVGGPNFDFFSYDHVKKSRRQVGSTFKPFVYAAAIRDGVLTPCNEYPDVEYCIDVEKAPGMMKSWCPKNAGSRYSGDLTPVKCALAGSMNNITVKIMDMVGPEAVVGLVEDLGIKEGYIEPMPAICLGTMDLSVYEMVGAQSAFANKGVYIKPTAVVRVEDRMGNIIIDLNPETKQAMNEQTAYLMLNLMKGVVHGARNPHTGKYYGTAGGLRMASRDYGGILAPTAGKTGTTQGASDGWFIGITPDLVTGIWVGAEDRSVRFRNLRYGQGGRMAMPIYGYYMKQVYKDKSLDISQKDFEAPIGFDPDILNCKDQEVESNPFSNGSQDIDWDSL